MNNHEATINWLREKVKKSKFDLIFLDLSPSPLGGVSLIVSKRDLTSLPLSLNISEKELNEPTQERLLESVLPDRWQKFLRSSKIARQKHNRRLAAGKKGLDVTVDSLSVSDGSQIQTKSDGYVK